LRVYAALEALAARPEPSRFELAWQTYLAAPLTYAEAGIREACLDILMAEPMAENLVRLRYAIEREPVLGLAERLYARLKERGDRLVSLPAHPSEDFPRSPYRELEIDPHPIVEFV